MLYNVCLLAFNNYINRKNIVYDTLEEYLNNSSAHYNWHYENSTLIAFNENDGVNATITFNNYNRAYDYLLVLDSDDEIVSRWFILDETRNLKGQYELSLKRDSVADYRSQVLSADSYLYKGFVPYGNPLLYNSEGLSLNQVKISERLLKDTTQVPWIVGYVAPNIDNSSKTAKVYGAKYDYKASSWSNTPFSFVTGAGTYNNIVIENDLQAKIYIKNNYFVGWDNFIDYYNYSTNTMIRTEEDFSGYATLVFDFEDTLTSFNPSNFDKSYFANDFRTLTNTQLCAVDDNTYKIVNLNGVYYKVEFTSATSGTQNSTSTTVGQQFCNAYNVNISKYRAYYTYTYTKYNVVVTALSNPTQTSFDIEVNYIGDNSYNLIDAPYKMFCMPYSDVRQKLSNNSWIETSKENQIQYATALATALDGFLYDLQIVPYCPITSSLASVSYSNNKITMNMSTNQTYITRSGTTDILSAIYWCQASTFNFTIDTYKINISDSEAKLRNEIEFYRICSPNYNGTFEFNPVKNQGVNAWRVDCTYKPYTPHIHVAPNFNGLYGRNFDDSRGLICSGDFSIPRVNSEWASYEINNKNYQLQFQRQIDTMELQNKIGYVNSGVNAVMSGITNTLHGAFTGGVAGAVAMGSVGALQSALNIGEQVIMNNEKISAMQDQYNYNLQNIQARPYSLTNIGVLNYDYKYFPFVERYGCTSTETKALRNKLKYEGFTLNVIAKIKDYIGDLTKGDMTNYIRAKLIRINIEADSHIVNDINNELQMGLYFE